MNNAPIGIFDSGLGGLTVARAIIDKLPDEEIIYLGDTEHTPLMSWPLAASKPSSSPATRPRPQRSRMLANATGSTREYPSSRSLLPRPDRA